MKRVKIYKVSAGNTYFVDKSIKGPIFCAFEEDRKCSPQCMACEKAGDRSFCNRMPENNQLIGFIEEE